MREQKVAKQRTNQRQQPLELYLAWVSPGKKNNTNEKKVCKMQTKIYKVSF
ncbi:hypothetical protein THF1C08_130129 [Vibrio jasicida]|nr:hypothetical protein THF1C08_130129 [Vibrio jasicida]